VTAPTPQLSAQTGDRHFNPTVLREYDKSAAAALGRRRVAVGCDGQFSSSAVEAALVGEFARNDIVPSRL
jgi:phosphomannomutase